MRPLALVLAAILLMGCLGTDAEAKTASNSIVIVSGETLELKPAPPRKFVAEGMRAPVVPLSLDGNELVPPDDPKTLGWWGKKIGANKGVTLLVGHTVSTGGGTLDDLEEVALGEEINVSGKTYSVTSNQVISKAELARRAPHLFSQGGSHRLVVVTCEDYDPATGTYKSNVVTVAE